MSFLLAYQYDYLKLFYVQNILAILGGATIGFFLTGYLLSFAVRSNAGKGITGTVVWVLRLMGGLVVAVLVALFLLGPGGAGWFGGSGDGTGNSKDSQPANKDAKPPEKDTVTPPVKDNTPPGERSLFVEVLMNDEIRAAVGDDGVAEKRYYRVRGSRPEALLTLKQVREKLENDKPPYRMLYLVLGKDRSAKDVDRVEALTKEAKKLHIPFDETAP
jgi:hypothetical protein